MYDELAARKRPRKGSRTGGDPNVHPQTKRTYLFRGMLFCSCGRRMIGVPRHDRSYYLCRPSNTNRGRPDKYLEHEKALYFREDAIIEAVSRFFAERVFSVDRRAVLERELAGVDDQGARDREAEASRLGKALNDLTKKQNSILLQAADGEPDDPFTKALRGRYNDLEKQRAGIASALADLGRSAEAESGLPIVADVDLIDALPYLALNLAQAPEGLLRTLFEVTQLGIRIDAEGDRATLEITLPEDQLPVITGAAERITEEMSSQVAPGGRACEVAVCAPGEIRTHTGRVLNPLPLPVGLRGRDAVTLRDHCVRRVTGAQSVAPATTW
jgi:site-specific DNA recombinase